MATAIVYRARAATISSEHELGVRRARRPRQASGYRRRCAPIPAPRQGGGFPDSVERAWVKRGLLSATASNRSRAFGSAMKAVTDDASGLLTMWHAVTWSPRAASARPESCERKSLVGSSKCGDRAISRCRGPGCRASVQGGGTLREWCSTIKAQVSARVMTA